jgi:hypothetical protein
MLVNLLAGIFIVALSVTSIKDSQSKAATQFLVEIKGGIKGMHLIALAWTEPSCFVRPGDGLAAAREVNDRNARRVLYCILEPGFGCGLRAGGVLKSKGFDVTILEARDRIGGQVSKPQYSNVLFS